MTYLGRRHTTPPPPLEGLIGPSGRAAWYPAYEAFGATLINLDKVYHGIATDIKVTVPSELTFEGLPTTFKAGRYHSWAVATKDFPSDLEITAVDEKNQIMALRHKTYDVRGVQFHPESILTEHGEQMVLNWLKH